ncbi:MAG: hypothetical protein ABS81_01160 [Pseudonocardia sp. SCN 72-86]|nr:MAG: hypothetical protein ABS81_01160 [Pseudonocardia sp. SCN 72-86]
MTDQIDVTIDDWTAVVTVEDFSPLSRHDAALLRGLRDVVVELSDHDEVKTVVLRARGDDFAPAASPDALPPSAVLTSWHRDVAGSSALYQALTFAKKVVVTEVRGDCLGAGSLLVLCSDLTIAADTARFGSPFADLPESNFALAALTMRLNRAKSWMLTGSVLDAQAAYAAGLVNRVVPEADLMTAVEGLSASTSEMPLDGVTMSKMLLQSVLDTHGVGRDFDLADHFAVHRWSPREAQA